MANQIKLTDGIFEGSGPFAIPLLAQVTSLDNPGHPECALLRFVFEDGATVFVPVANQAVADLIDMLAIHQAKLAQAEASDKTKH